ncbi:Sua5/YciO/YrdC/YwlC family protein [Dictyocaulus viviparus]|uniref:Threonylcarbamoyl-AMP synthase n=1 Tax=Dictyocaulus viviparus TaxID=29172 RepID=A0A0D8XJJ8_DICVI|nr:Sua5/YciO/YrdC/YwlC family protein [Dictyocaulus viviparus]
MPTASLADPAKVIRITPETFDEAVETAAEVLLRGGVVALPTDTLYGVSTLIEYSNKLYLLKNRPVEKPLGLFFSNPTEINQYARLTISSCLARQLLPGPVTLIFNRLPSLPLNFNPHIENVGVRVPDSPLVRAVCARLGQPLAQTSANISGSEMNPTCIEDFSHLMNQIDLVLDGGVLGKLSNEKMNRDGSTVVDLTHKHFYRIIREGCALKQTEETLKAAGIRPL